jgi:hypothetical protein
VSRPNRGAAPPKLALSSKDLDTIPPMRSWFGVGVALGVLNLPKLGAGVQATAELRPEGAWPIDISLIYFFDNEAELDRDELDLRANDLIGVTFPTGGSRLHVSAAQASAALCPYERELRPGVLILCAGVQGGLMWVRGEGFMSQTDNSHGLFAFEGYARWHFPISEAIGASYSAGLFVPFLRDHFGYLDRYSLFTSKFRVGAVGGRLDLLLTYGF